MRRRRLGFFRGFFTFFFSSAVETADNFLKKTEVRSLMGLL